MDGGPGQMIIRRGIGGSDAPAAVGLSEWLTPIELYQRLLGEAEDDVETEAMRWGRLLEAPIRAYYAEVTRAEVIVPATSIFHAEHAWRRATPDGIVVHAGSGRWLYGLEVKTADWSTRESWGEPGTDEVPLNYLTQCAWYMHVTGLDRWDLVVLIGGRDPRIYRIDRDAEFEAELVDAITAFWVGHVEAKVPPPPDHTDAFRRYLVRRWPSVRDDYLVSSAEMDELVAMIVDRRALMARLERHDAADCNRLCTAIADAAGLITTSGKVHWKPQRGRQLVNWEAVARDLADKFDFGELALLAQTHTKTARPARPLRLPRPRQSALKPDSDEEPGLFEGVVLGPGGNLGPTEDEERLSAVARRRR